MKQSYHEWYLEHEQKVLQMIAQREAGETADYKVVRYSHLKNFLLSGEELPTIIIACDDDGQLSAPAVPLILSFFADHPDVNILYGDEDRLREDGTHTAPWMKSDWAPDTFLSTFYPGSVIAFRSEALLTINPGLRKASDIEDLSTRRQDSMDEEMARTNEDDDPMRAWIYGKLFLKLAQADGGFLRRNRHMLQEKTFPVGHIPEILFHARARIQLWDSTLIRESLTGRYSRESAATRPVSIILPSRDNPEMLKRCITSVVSHTRMPLEIIIVDNGSNPDNRRKVEQLTAELNENGRALYVYREGPFNMARFYNIGASVAGGEMLLFLHDDIEVNATGWLSHLSEKAKLPYVGAAGIKLLFPSSNIIQHAGIHIVGGEPVNKLRLRQNEETHYFDYNKGVRNVLAVSGACMMVRREVFEEAEGFDEVNFPECFSDVDFCLRLFEKGYYNVVRNNMYLYYYERGSEENERTREERLQHRPAELDRLRMLHPWICEGDPYYSPYLSRDPKETRFYVELQDTDVRA